MIFNSKFIFFYFFFIKLFHTIFGFCLFNLNPTSFINCSTSFRSTTKQVDLVFLRVIRRVDDNRVKAVWLYLMKPIFFSKQLKFKFKIPPVLKIWIFEFFFSRPSKLLPTFQNRKLGALKLHCGRYTLFNTNRLYSEGYRTFGNTNRFVLKRVYLPQCNFSAPSFRFWKVGSSLEGL